MSEQWNCATESLLSTAITRLGRRYCATETGDTGYPGQGLIATNNRPPWRAISSNAESSLPIDLAILR